MHKNGLVVGGVVLLVVAGLAVFLVNRPSSHDSTGQSNTSMSSMNMPKKTTDDATKNEKPVATSSVAISDFTFNPGTVTVKTGTKVTWTNQDSVVHSVIADTPSSTAPSSSNLRKGDSYSFTFTQAGTYHYHCAQHPYMKGTVIVTE